MGRWVLLFSLLPTLGLLGCQSALPSCETPVAPVHSDYALVEYRLREDAGNAPKVSISDTDTYRNEHAGYGAAALRLPESCLSEGASLLPGAAPQSQLKVDCKAWLGEIERALSGAGFRVMSWDSLLRLEREKGLSTYNAAKELGADIVFVFNGLESSNVTASESKLGKHEYFESDEHGGRGAALVLDEPTRSAFLKYTMDAAAKSVKAEEVIALSSLLDTTAIVTATGESVWFYRRSWVRPTSAKQGLKLLFGRAAGGGWTPAAPVTDPGAPPEAAPAPSASAPNASAPSADAFEKERLELIKAGADHFVESFKSGKLDASPEEERDR